MSNPTDCPDCGNYKPMLDALAEAVANALNEYENFDLGELGVPEFRRIMEDLATVHSWTRPDDGTPKREPTQPEITVTLTVEEAEEIVGAISYPPISHQPADPPDEATDACPACRGLARIKTAIKEVE